MDTVENIELVKMARRGNKNAYGELVHMYKDEMYKVAFSYMRCEEEAVDVVSDSVCKGFVNIKRLKKDEFFKTWIIRIVINNANNALKKRERERKFKMIFQKNAEDVIYDQKSNHEEEMDLRDEIKRLDKRSRDMIILRYYNGYTLNKISEVMECPVGTVKSTINRALGKLRNNLERGGVQYEFKRAR